jgi:hypothetical protein
VSEDPLRKRRSHSPAARVVGRLPYLFQPRRQCPDIIPRRPSCISPPFWFRFLRTQRPDRRLAVVAQQSNRLIDELPAMLGPCTLVAPSQLSQHLLSRPRTHRFVPVGDGNRTFGATTLSDPQSQPIAGNKHFGAIRPYPLTLCGERFNWIGRAGCVFFRKSFVVHSLRAFHRPAPRSRLVLRKNPRRHPFPPN